MAVIEFRRKEKRKRIRKRLLRTYIHIAQRDYSCSKCGRRIDAGDEYLGEVWAVGREIHVWRFHHCPPCDDDNPSKKLWEKEEREEREREASSLAA